MSDTRRPRVVVTIHGIRTHGRWQKEITPYLAEHGLVPYHIDYGWFGAIKFFFPCTRSRQVQAIRRELRTLVERVKARRVSVIAHSFGTFLAMECLARENGQVRYDRVVLTGCILPRDFDWKALIEKRWVMAVRNERATSDVAVELAKFASSWWMKWLFRLRAGDSGRLEFTQKVPTVLDDYIVGPHSETHNPLKYEQWARFIAYPNLPDDLLQRVRTEMQALRERAAQMLGHGPELVRVNLFAPMDGALRIVPGATDNMTYAPEFELEIQENHGATGTSFSSGNPCTVVKRGNSWTGNNLPSAELAKINPRLHWVVSLPIRSETRSRVVGVVNIDGLDNIPAVLQDSSTVEYQAVVFALFAGSLKPFQASLDAAFRGERMEQLES